MNVLRFSKVPKSSSCESVTPNTLSSLKEINSFFVNNLMSHLEESWFNKTAIMYWALLPKRYVDYLTKFNVSHVIIIIVLEVNLNNY